MSSTSSSKSGRDLESLKLYAGSPDLRKIILRLLNKPALGGAAEDFGQSHGHFRRYAAFLVYEFGKGLARHAKGLRRLCDAQAQRFNALAQHKAAGVRGIFHRHRFNSLG
jgi:hypothetical protein